MGLSALAYPGRVASRRECQIDFLDGSYLVKVNLYAAICWLGIFFATPAFAQDPGEATFKLKCAMCHGADGLSNTPAGKVLKAASFKDAVVLNKSEAELISIVKTGKNKMPAFGDKLSEDQIKSAVAYIHTLQK